MRRRSAKSIRAQAKRRGVSAQGKKSQVLRRLFAHSSHARGKGGFNAYREQMLRARASGAASFVYTGNGKRYYRGKHGHLITYSTRRSPK